MQQGLLPETTGPKRQQVLQPLTAKSFNPTFSSVFLQNMFLIYQIIDSSCVLCITGSPATGEWILIYAGVNDRRNELRGFGVAAVENVYLCKLKEINSISEAMEIELTPGNSHLRNHLFWGNDRQIVCRIWTLHCRILTPTLHCSLKKLIKKWGKITQHCVVTQEWYLKNITSHTPVIMQPFRII